MGRNIFDRWWEAGQRAEARRERWAVIERVVRLPLLAGLLVLALVGWWLSGWAMVPWLWGLGTLVLLTLLGLRARLGPARMVIVGLAVVVVALFTYVDPWWWGVLAGLAVTIGAVAAAVRLRFRQRRPQTITALVVGPLLLVGSVVGLSVDAHQRSADEAEANRQTHDFLVARGLPRTPNAMVFALVEFIARRDGKTACFLFSPEAAAAFAAAHNAPDCPGAVARLADQVRTPVDYQNNLWVPADAVTWPDAITSVVDACRLDWNSVVGDNPDPHPGPQLGILTLQQQYGEGHRIIGYRACATG